MFGFNTSGPTSLDAIDQYISSYATPEAAELDTRFNAPRGLDYLTNQYQNLSGDAFADPFEDASNQRARSMTEAAMNGASVATGSNTGMRLLSAPRPMAPPVQADPRVPAAPMPPTPLGLSPLGSRDVAKASLLKMLQTQGNQTRVASSDMQIPDTTAGNYLDVLSKRAALTGTTDIFEKIRQKNPTAFQAPSTNDPRFARDATGKVIGQGELHPLAFDDHFQEQMRLNPEKASAFYHAVTNRDYATDIDAKRKSIVEQRDARKKIIEGIKGLEADPITGDLYKIVESKDPFGTIQQQRVAITPLDKAAIEAEGGAKRIYGVDLPGMGGLKKIPGMSDKGHIEYRNRAAEVRKAHPELSTEQASAQALASMKSDQNKNRVANGSQGEKVGLLETMAQFNPKDILAAGVVNPVISAANATNKLFNVPSRAANALSALFGSDKRFAKTWDENMPLWNTSLSPDEVSQRAMVARILRERLGVAETAYAGE